MKQTSLFFGLLILILSCMPCRDVFAFGGSQKTTSVSIPQKVTHAENDQSNDLCSPFCMCSCCNVTSELSKPVHLAIILPELTSDYQILTPNRVTSLPISVWQPPKLG